MGLKTVYGFTDDGFKVAIGEVMFKDWVGGTIFYIDDTASGATYRFYDAQGVEMTNVSIGDTPTFYSVIGTPVKDKYYVSCDRNFAGGKWCNSGFMKSGNYSTNIGLGKQYTASMLAKESEISNPGNIWYTLNNINTQTLNQCNDWYVGTRDELEMYRTNIPDKASLFVNNTASSTDTTTGVGYYFVGIYSGTWQTPQKTASCTIIPIRSF